MAKCQPSEYRDDLPIAEAVHVDGIHAPSFGSLATSSFTLTEASRTYLAQKGLPPGLIEVLAKATTDCPTRYWIIDNSGSMSTQDGKLFVPGPNGIKKTVSSRWDELGATMRWHAETASALGTRVEFFLLNQPSNGAPQRVVVGVGDDQVALANLDKIIKSGPHGMTPLCATLNEVVAEIQASAPGLRAARKTACIIVASDGEASDGNVAQALAPLAHLPAVVVVRLCTDNDRVTSYWNNIDQDLELDLDVLDDLAGEGKEVHEFNPWLAYAEPLHRVREWGGAPKLLDLLDERSLTPLESSELMHLILGSAFAGLSDPRTQPIDFYREARAALQDVPWVFDADVGKLRPWIDLLRMEGRQRRYSMFAWAIFAVFVAVFIHTWK